MRTTLSTSYAHCAIQNIFMLRGKQAAQGAGGRGGRPPQPAPPENIET